MGVTSANLTPMPISYQSAPTPPGSTRAYRDVLLPPLGWETDMLIETHPLPWETAMLTKTCPLTLTPLPRKAAMPTETFMIRPAGIWVCWCAPEPLLEQIDLA